MTMECVACGASPPGSGRECRACGCYQVGERQCFDCDHRYTGPIRCPACGVGMGEPLDAATGWRGDWRQFAGRVEKRMARGAEEYGGNSYNEDPAVLVAEVRQELLDVAGWASILDARLEAIGAKLARVEVSQRQVARCHEDGGQ